jgi:hypothetical protein
MSVAEHIDPEDLTLYAMQFLSEEEAAPIVEHIGQCLPCREELQHIQGDMAMYACTVEMEDAPPLVRQRVMKQVAREKRVIPIGQPQQAPQPQLQQEQAQPPAFAAYARASGLFADAERDEQPVTAKRSTVRTLLDWSGWAVAAGLAFATVNLYRERDSLRSVISAQSGRIERVTQEADAATKVMDAFTDPKAQRITLTKDRAPAFPIGRAVYNPQKGSLIFLASNLDPLQQYKTYELWLISTDETAAPIPAGTFKPDDKGSASLILPELPKGFPARAFGVTVEDDGGSQTPTKPIVMLGLTGS